MNYCCVSGRRPKRRLAAFSRKADHERHSVGRSVRLAADVMLSVLPTFYVLSE